MVATQAVRERLLTRFVRLDPSPSTKTIRNHIQDPEVSIPSIRWLKMRQLRARPNRPSLSHRGAEDRQEGVEGDAGEEDWQEMSPFVFALIVF